MTLQLEHFHDAEGVLKCSNLQPYKHSNVLTLPIHARKHSDTLSVAATSLGISHRSPSQQALTQNIKRFACLNAQTRKLLTCSDLSSVHKIEKVSKYSDERRRAEVAPQAFV